MAPQISQRRSRARENGSVPRVEVKKQNKKTKEKNKKKGKRRRRKKKKKKKKKKTKKKNAPFPATKDSCFIFGKS